MVKGSSGALLISNFVNQPLAHDSGYKDNAPSTINFSATKSNIIYGGSATVQPKSLTSIFIIKT